MTQWYTIQAVQAVGNYGAPIEAVPWQIVPPIDAVWTIVYDGPLSSSVQAAAAIENLRLWFRWVRLADRRQPGD